MISLFVYGTLRTPAGGPKDDTGNYPQIEPHVSSSIPAVLRGAKMCSLIHYPGIRPGTGSVIGEILEMSEEGLRIADEIEGHPDWYVRERVTVETADGAERDVWTYWAPEDLFESGLPIESGNWFSRDRSADDGRTQEQAIAEDRENL